jgi:hypothetical protein
MLTLIGAQVCPHHTVNFSITSETVHYSANVCCWVSKAPPNMFYAQNKSTRNLKLILAPDANQLEWIEGGLHLDGGIQGGGVGVNFGKQFRPKDDKIQKVDLLVDNGERWKGFRMQTKTVFVTVLCHENGTLIGEENFEISRGDRVCFRNVVA